MLLAGSPVASQESAAPSLVRTPCFFNGQLVPILIAPLTLHAATEVLAQNRNVDRIFEASGFAPVIDEIQGPRFNLRWRVVTIRFNPGVRPHQFRSAAEILAAASSEITLTFTVMVDAVPVVG
jgi:hypothetical protein